MEKGKHLNAGTLKQKAMTISTFTLSALLASAINAGAQTATKDISHKEPVKKNKTEKAIAQTKNTELKDSLKPAYTEKKRHYCPACGRG